MRTTAPRTIIGLRGIATRAMDTPSTDRRPVALRRGFDCRRFVCQPPLPEFYPFDPPFPLPLPEPLFPFPFPELFPLPEPFELVLAELSSLDLP